MPSPSDTLKPRGHRFRRFQLVDHIDRADVDAELQRSRRHQGVETPRLQVVFHLQADFLGHRPVMRADFRLAVAQLGQTQRRSLGLVAAVGEDQGRLVATNVLEQQLVRARPQGRVARLQKVGQRSTYLHVQVLAHSGVDDLAGTLAPCPGPTGEEGGDLLQRTQCCRAPHPLQSPLEARLQALQTHREVHPPLVVAQSVHLIDDHRADRRKVRRHTFARQQDVERLRGGDENVGRAPDHLRPFVLGRVAGADGDANLRQVPLSRSLANARQRLEQVLVNVVPQRLQRTDIQDLYPLGQVALLGLAP